jgi:hypothetical protein
MKEMNHFEDLRKNQRIILKIFLKNNDLLSGQGHFSGSCKYGN